MSILRRPFVHVLAIAFSALAGFQAQAGTGYECAINQVSSNGSWLPEVVVVGSKDSDAKPEVFDPVIKYFVGHPIVAKVETENDRRVTYTWEVKVKANNNQFARMLYRLTVTKKNLAAQMTAQPLGYEDVFIAPGTCKKVKL